MQNSNSPSDAPRNPASEIGFSRRTFLRYVGAGAATLVLGNSNRLLAELPSSRAWVLPDGKPNWKPPAYPVPLPGDPGDAGDDRLRLASYEVIDDLVLPEGFEYEVLARFGDIFGPDDSPTRQIRFGYNCDYTGLVPVADQEDQFWLLVNHEYVSARPWLDVYETIYGQRPPTFRLVADHNDPPMFKRGIFSIDGWSFEAFAGNAVDVNDPEQWARVPDAVKAKARANAERILDEVGVSVLRVRRRDDGGFEVVADADDHRRISAFRRHNIPGGPAVHSRFTGPAVPLFDRQPHGTMTNCSGGTTPWGTFLTCEENYYNEVDEDVSPEGRLIESRKSWYGARGDKVNGLYIFDNEVPPNISGNGHLLEDRLDGRHFGWVTEIEPTTGHLRKHTGLGRFRHENVTLRVEAGKRLAAYMGDDRRGGHIWKFVSDEVVRNPSDPDTSRLLEKGTLYVARFEPDFTGRWIPLDAETPLRRPEPEQCFSGHMQVPSRFVGGSVSVGNPDRDRPDIEVDNWISIIESFTGKSFEDSTLADLVRPHAGVGSRLSAAEWHRLVNGILAMDAFLMANACGGTPTARPEDLEVHPVDRSVFIAFTDATDSSDGSPDRRIFPDSAMENSRQYGAIYRLIEDGGDGADSDPAATTFTWGKFISSGEVADHGGGFACADNLVFDVDANLWVVTDISTTSQNFPTSRVVTDGTNPGGKTFPGVFGNNAMFMLPTRGAATGLPHLFALAPIEAELCGPTFSDDGQALILSVQHPGEDDATRRDGELEVQRHVVHDRNNRPFEQTRKIPVGSNFPAGDPNTPPRPAVVCIRRLDDEA
ncbi:MAG: DUF839 domain-containing protein [Thermoanaerobaculia bacterium]|nr:DUF839 domain-containing protein [Thermoanaerobaculia bacterium]